MAFIKCQYTNDYLLTIDEQVIFHNEIKEELIYEKKVSAK